ncbi:hypothetical protein TSUD_364160 [Trifolium subterraneum]|uniref:Reverse transcriptase zinc-binding domain-containing protein n=1 Tax=Trifolium subterraneum TaxID=3900 RepID=A0A2Z6MG90_TRISU|nr:hypothetical protein TSUD_364160 [Trifolium subterraneum]
MVERNLFTGYSVGESDPISVLHLQFADDTLLVGFRCWANVCALTVVLVMFETMSGLKVNFNKSMLVGVNIPGSWLGEAASILRCKVGKIPFLYLGLPIGSDPRRLSFCEPVLARLTNILSRWKSRFLSFGGRLILIKSVLTSLSVYALSFFKAPLGTISSIESLLINFFWGGSEDHRKISWISWKNICLRKEYGGLGVSQLREFNLALLGKWCWRMLVDREGLWFRVLAARYGVERGRLKAGGRRGSSWWREIARHGNKTHIHGIGTGLGIPELYGFGFGEGKTRPRPAPLPCLEITSIRDNGGGVGRFGRLFNLAETNSCLVVEMASLGWGASGEAWVWRRQLWVWEEEMLGECQSLLLDLLTSQDPVTLDDVKGLIWHSQVPLKVSIFAWQLLRDRLPTKANLITRCILSSEFHHCVSGCGAIESAHHLFLSCSTFSSLWSHARSWIGSSLMDSHTISYHFVQFISSAGGSRARRSFMQLIWLVCAWVISKERNHILRLTKLIASHVGQDQDIFLSVVEGEE